MARIRGAVVRQSGINMARIRGAVVRQSGINMARIRGAVVRQSGINMARIRGAVVRQSGINMARIRGAVVRQQVSIWRGSGAQLYGSRYQYGADQGRSCTAAGINMARIRGAVVRQSGINMARIRGAVVRQSATQSWTDDLPLCQLCGVGSAVNRVYTPDGKAVQEHPYEDGYMRFQGEDGCCLYGVFNGYDGSRVVSFVSQRLSAELLLGQLTVSHGDADVRRVLLQAFDVVEKSFLESIDDALAERANLLSQLPEGVPFHQLPQQLQKIAERVSVVEQEVSGGATAVVALILNKKLYGAVSLREHGDYDPVTTARVAEGERGLCLCLQCVCLTLSLRERGDYDPVCRGLDGACVQWLWLTVLCVQQAVLCVLAGRLDGARVQQAVLRWLDGARIKQAGLIGGQSSTRRIGDYRAGGEERGDYRVKYEYTDMDLLSASKSKPIIAEPEVHGGHSLDGVTGFLLLMSDGLYKALEAAHGPEQANQALVATVAAECAQQTSLDAVAQAVVDRVCRLHHDTFASGRERAKDCLRHEDMTLLIRSFSYPLGGEAGDPALTPTQGGRLYPVSVPYSNAQSTSKTSVTLSLVMPSQGPVMNGSHTNSTVDETTPTLTNQSPTATLQSSGAHTQSTSSSSGDGSLFRHRGHALQPDENGRVEPYVDFTSFYRLWSREHQESSAAVLGPQ
ncbi:TGF-beta-activated kinase 1 and MAP3K7-binding protein 1 [Polyodon spathula]|uniref:TGF-beta-activated kinase 1 and MAP3K7-binding protein 1 n=1 Tax=Polyodon spathula TaxID=7913 RepID=UPI001B7E91C7|nr:TGF-beta-activated kinase 1 and MAP3K7-binding protein 1 [Polyodon spathula]